MKVVKHGLTQIFPAQGPTPTTIPDRGNNWQRTPKTCWLNRCLSKKTKQFKKVDNKGVPK